VFTRSRGQRLPKHTKRARMEKSVGLSSAPSPASDHPIVLYSAPSSPFQHPPLSPSLSQASPTTPTPTAPDLSSIPDHLSLPAPPLHVLRKRTPHATLIPEDDAISARVAARCGLSFFSHLPASSMRSGHRIASCLASDHIAAILPDVDTPFRNVEDVIGRLLPYHVFQHPQEDIRKGKRKATAEDLLKEELSGTPYLVCSMYVVS